MKKPEDGDKYNWDKFVEYYKPFSRFTEGKEEDHWHFWTLGYITGGTDELIKEGI